MDEVSGWWSGAHHEGRGLDVLALADAAGGFRPLIDGGYDALVDAGLEPARAARWVSARPLRTAFTAVTLDSPRYSALLKSIPEPPPVLFVDGDVSALSMPAVAVVGTRSCTSYGSSIARRLGAALAAAGVVTVSGLARGVDAAAHRGAMAVGRTVAVVGHGLGFTSPASHDGMRSAMVASGSAVVSTWPDDVRPFPSNFPIRNRWIAGLASALVVVEAPVRSGAGITAREAGDLGRPVWAVPGPIGAPASEGCNRMLADRSATAVVDVDELVATLTGASPSTGPEHWLNVLFNGATVDDTARRVGCSVSELLARLSKLELEGVVVRLPGQRYAPTGAT